MEVRTLDLNEYKAAVASKKDDFFASEVWCDAHRESCLPLGIFSKSNLIATLLLYQYKKLGKTFVIQPPLAPHCGLSIVTTAEKRSTQQTQVKRVLKALADYLVENYKDAYIDFCFPKDIIDGQPFQWKDFSVSPRYSYRLDIDRSEEQLLEQMSTERRKNIRKGHEQGYGVAFDKNPNDLMLLLGQTAEKAGFKFQEVALRRLLESSESGVYTTLIYSGDKPIAGALCVSDAKCSYYLSGGHDAGAGDHLAGAYCLWNSILKAKESGSLEFDFQGSSIPDIEKYFRGFGPELFSYTRIMRSRGVLAWLKRQKDKAN